MAPVTVPLYDQHVGMATYFDSTRDERMRTLAGLAEIRQGMALSGRAAGARPGDWRLRAIESADITDGRVDLEGGREIEVERTERTERHLLRPYDILVTARSQTVKAALVPPEVSRTVAGSTLLVVRTQDPASGLAHFLWYYLCSMNGRRQVEAQLTGSTLPSLSASALGEVSIEVPALAELRRLADLIGAAEESYRAAIEAAHLRRDLSRDTIVGMHANAQLAERT